MRDQLSVFNNQFTARQLRNLPKEAFYNEEVIEQNKNRTDPYVDNLFKIRPYIANNSYVCNIAKSALYENPVDQLNKVTYINNVPVEDEERYIRKNVNNLQLLNMYRHRQDFLFINLNDIPKFYKDFKDFLDHYHMVLSTSYNYVNIDKNIVNDIEIMLSEFYNKFKYLIDPDKQYEDNNLINLGNNNSLFRNAVNRTNESYIKFNTEEIQSPHKFTQEIYEHSTVTTVDFNSNSKRVSEDEALPEINFGDDRLISKEIKF